MRLQKLEFDVKTRREEHVKIGLVLTQEVAQGSDQFIQVANILMNEWVFLIAEHIKLNYAFKNIWLNFVIKIYQQFIINRLLSTVKKCGDV